MGNEDTVSVSEGECDESITWGKEVLYTQSVIVLEYMNAF